MCQKVPLSANTHRTEINLNFSNDDIYQEIDLYNEIAAWNALLGSSKMLRK